MTSTRSEVGRFLVCGTINTLASYALYLGLLRVVDYRMAYSCAFVAGIVLSYSLNTHFVFREPWSWRKLGQFPVVYVAQYLVGLALMWLLVVRLEVDDRLAPLAVIALTVPLTYLLARTIISRAPR